jgi:hypothetical protein
MGFVGAKERFSEKKQKMLSDRWKDPEFRARHAAASRKMLSDRWKDPEFRARNAAAIRVAVNRRLREEAQAIVAALERRTARRVA